MVFPKTKSYIISEIMYDLETDANRLFEYVSKIKITPEEKREITDLLNYLIEMCDLIAEEIGVKH